MKQRPATLNGRSSEAQPCRRILFITNRVPFPPDKGDRIRTFHQLDYLARRHDVYCACFTHDDADIEHARTLRQWCRDVIAIPWTPVRGLMVAVPRWIAGRPLTEATYQSKAMVSQLRAWGRAIDFDASIVFSSMMAPYSRVVNAKRRVIDLCDVDSEKWRDYGRSARFPVSFVWHIEARRVRREETRCVEASDASILITEQEKQLLSRDCEGSKMHVVPNGVRRAEFSARPSACGPCAGFLGTMDYRPNVEAVTWFVREVWPLILKHMPGALFYIVGRDPVAAVRRLSRLPGVIVTGRVDDPTVYVARCRVMLAPLKLVRGIPNKVLESMSAGRPVVSTRAVAEAIGASCGDELLTGDTPMALCEQTVRLLRDDRLADDIGQRAARFTADRYDWQDVLQRFERVVLGDVESAPGARSADARILRPSAASMKAQPVTLASRP